MSDRPAAARLAASPLAAADPSPSGNRLAGQTAVVGGGTGNLGEGLVAAFLAEGAARVVVPTRSPRKENGLRDYLENAGVTAGDRLAVWHFDVSDFAAAREFGDRLQADLENRGAAIALAVASLGTWWTSEPLHAIDPDRWAIARQANLDSHFGFARAVLPILRAQNSGTYIAMNGKASEEPLPGVGLTCTFDAAQKMLLQVLAAENRDRALRLYGLASYSVLATRFETDPDPDWLRPADVAEAMLRLHVGAVPEPEEPWQEIFTRSGRIA